MTCRCKKRIVLSISLILAALSIAACMQKDYEVNRITTHDLPCESLHDLAISPDGKWLAAAYQTNPENDGRQGDIVIYSTKDLLRNASADPVYRTGYFSPYISWAPDSKEVAWSGIEEVAIWSVDAQTIDRTFQIEPVEGPARSIFPEKTVWSPHGDIFLSGIGIRTAHDSQTGDILQTLIVEDRPGPSIYGPFAEWHPETSTILVYGFSHSHSAGMQIWDSQTWEVVYDFPDIPHEGFYGTYYIYDNPSWSPDGQYLVYTLGFREELDRVMLWDFSTQEATELFQGDIARIEWSPNGDMIAFSTKDNFFLWDHVGEEKLYESGKPYAYFEWSPDGKFIVFKEKKQTGEGAILTLWDVAQKEEIYHEEFSQLFRTYWFPDSTIFVTTQGCKMVFWSIN